MCSKPVITSDRGVFAGPSATAGAEAVLSEIVLELELTPGDVVVEDADTDEREVGGASPLSLDDALSLLLLGRLFPSRLLAQSVNIDKDKRDEASIPTILAIDFSFWTDFLTDFSGDKAAPLGKLWVPLINAVVPP